MTIARTNRIGIQKLTPQPYRPPTDTLTLDALLCVVKQREEQAWQDVCASEPYTAGHVATSHLHGYHKGQRQLLELLLQEDNVVGRATR